MDDLTGRTIGPYELRDLIGTGGMATVYRAVHRALGQPRAVKILLPTHAADPTLLERFRSEAKLAAGLRHPNIVPIYDVGEQGDRFYLVMDFVEGVPLGRLLEHSQALPVGRALYLLRQLASALDYAHGRGVIHRDVKAGNILVSPDDHVTLFDFGIARGVELGRLTKPGLMVGTPHYLAPEVISGDEGDQRADLYALGILAYEMLTGRLPFTGSDTMAVLYAQVNNLPPPLRETRPELPVAVEQVIKRQLSKRPEERYPTAAGFVGALSDAAHGVPPLPEPSATVRLDMPGTARPTSARVSSVPTPPSVSSAGRPAPKLDYDPGDPVTPPSLFREVHEDDTPTPRPIERPSQLVAINAADVPDVPTSRGQVGLAVAPPGWPIRRAVMSRGPGRGSLALLLAGVVLLVLLAVGLLAFRQSRSGTLARPTATVAAAAQAPAAAVQPSTAPVITVPTAVVVAARATAPAPSATPLPTAPPTSRPAPTSAPTAPPTVVVAVVPPPPSPEQQLGAAQAAVERGDFPSALQVLGALQAATPSPAGLDETLYRAHLGYGQQLLDQGQLDESAAEFGEALKIKPDDPAALDGQKQATLAKLWRTMEAAWDQDDAVATAALEEILTLDPGYRDASVKLYALLVARAQRLLDAGDRDGALEALQRAVAVYPDGSEGRALLDSLTAPPPEPAPEQPAAAPAQQRAPAPAPAAAPASQPSFNPPPIQPPQGVPAIPNPPAGVPRLP